MYGKKSFIMLVKFFDDELGKVVNRFWDSKITNKATADFLIKAIINSFREHIINLLINIMFLILAFFEKIPF